MKVKVFMVGKAPVEIDVEPVTTFEIVGQIIEAECGIPLKEQEIIYNNRQIINLFQTVEFFGLKDGDSLKVRRKSAAGSFSTFNDMQKRIEEQIKQQHIHESYEKAVEYHPESFVPVEMLYVNCFLNKHSIQAFVDTGAQKSVIGVEMVEKCELSHLLDTRFSGVAIGVGQAKILGTLHYIPVQIGSRFLPCSISVVENLGPEFILGLDMLKRHQISINLKLGCLEIEGEQVKFVASTGKKPLSSTEESIKQLMELGVSKQTAIDALEAASGDPVLAASFLTE